MSCLVFIKACKDSESWLHASGLSPRRNLSQVCPRSCVSASCCCVLQAFIHKYSVHSQQDQLNWGKQAVGQGMAAGGTKSASLQSGGASGRVLGRKLRVLLLQKSSLKQNHRSLSAPETKEMPMQIFFWDVFGNTVCFHLGKRNKCYRNSTHTHKHRQKQSWITPKKSISLKAEIFSQLWTKMAWDCEQGDQLLSFNFSPFRKKKKK